jgi:hypothetical protein
LRCETEDCFQIGLHFFRLGTDICYTDREEWLARGACDNLGYRVSR